MLQPGEGVFHQMPIAVKPSIQIRVAFDGITLSWDYGLGTSSSNLFPDFLSVITPDLPDSPYDRHVLTAARDATSVLSAPSAGLSGSNRQVTACAGR